MSDPKATFDASLDAAWDAYKKAMCPIEDAYNTARKPALESFKTARKNAEDAYRKGAPDA